MRFLAVLNRDGGTLRTTDIESFTKRTAEVLASAGHSVAFEIVSGGELVQSLERSAAANGVETVLVGGGDGTISAAASILMKSGKTLAILPAGTMNLFARSLLIPQQLDAAIDSFATGEVKSVDMATANGKPFVHQFSIGLHAKMVDLRDKMEFNSRLGKIGASVRAAFHTLKNPPSLKVRLRIGDTEIATRTSGIGVSNNLFGEGHLPYADIPDGGVLGIYVTVAKRRVDMVLHSLNMLRGKWRDNSHVDIHESEAVEIRLLSDHRKFASVIDGELNQLEKTTILRILPKALNVLVPSTVGAKANAA